MDRNLLRRVKISRFDEITETKLICRIVLHSCTCIRIIEIIDNLRSQSVKYKNKEGINITGNIQFSRKS